MADGLSTSPNKETVTLRLPSGEMVDALVPAGFSDADLKSYVRMKRPDLFGAPAGVQKPQVNMQTGEGPLAAGMTSMETQLSQMPAGMWNLLKQSWNDPKFEPVGTFVQGLNPVQKVDQGTPAERMDWGATAANVLPYLLSARGALEETPTSKLTAPVRGAVKGANKVLQNYPKTVGAAAGGAIGQATHLPLARELGAGIGAAVGSEVLPKVRVPGEGFGLPNRVTGGPEKAPQYISPSKVSTTAPESSAPVSLNRLTSDIQSLGYSKADALARAKAGIAKYPDDLNKATTEAMRPSRTQAAAAPITPPSKAAQVAQVRTAQTAPQSAPIPAVQDKSTILPRMQALAQQIQQHGQAPAEPSGPPLRIAGKDVPANTNLAPALQKSLPQNRIEGKIMQVVRREGVGLSIGRDRLMDAPELRGIDPSLVEKAAISLGKQGKIWHEPTGGGAHAASYTVALKPKNQ